MAIRGTAFLIDDFNVIESMEFNRSMFPGDGDGDEHGAGLGCEFLYKLSKVGSELDFREFIDRFNRKYFNYSSVVPQTLTKNAKEFFDEIYKDFSIYLEIDYFSRFFSDWIFFKNISSKNVVFYTMDGKELNLLPGKTMRFHFGRIYEYKDLI